MVILVNGRFLIPGKLEGIGLYTFEIIRRLAQRHPEHHFVVCVDRSSSMQFELGKNVSYELIFPPARHPLLFLWWFEYGIPRAFKKYKARLFFSPDGFCSLSQQVDKTLLVIHDLAYLHYPDHIGKVMRSYYQYFSPRFIAKATEIITVSQATKSDLSIHFPNCSDKISVIYNGVRSLLPQSRPPIKSWQSQLNGRPYFIVLGSIHPRKNLTNVLRAFGVFKSESQSEACLLIVGRMAWKTSDIKKIFESHLYREDIIFTGYLEDGEMFLALEESLALVYVSLFEGFGLPLVEAMAKGVAVITSNRSSMSEIVNGAGLLVDPESPEDIAGAMSRIIHDGPLRSQLIKAGIQRSNRFNWDQAAEETWIVMTRITGEV